MLLVKLSAMNNDCNFSVIDNVLCLGIYPKTKYLLFCSWRSTNDDKTMHIGSPTATCNDDITECPLIWTEIWTSLTAYLGTIHGNTTHSYFEVRTMTKCCLFFRVMSRKMQAIMPCSGHKTEKPSHLLFSGTANEWLPLWRLPCHHFIHNPLLYVLYL